MEGSASFAHWKNSYVPPRSIALLRTQSELENKLALKRRNGRGPRLQFVSLSFNSSQLLSLLPSLTFLVPDSTRQPPHTLVPAPTVLLPQHAGDTLQLPYATPTHARTSPRMKTSFVLLATALLSATSTLAHAPTTTFNEFLTRSLGNGTFDERSGVFTAHEHEAFDKRSAFDASVGIMIERDMIPGGEGGMEKRTMGSEPRTTRDVLRREIELDLTERGEISWPTNFDDVSRLAKRATKKVVKKASSSRKFSASLSCLSVTLPVPKLTLALQALSSPGTLARICAFLRVAKSIPQRSLTFVYQSKPLLRRPLWMDSHRHLHDRCCHSQLGQEPPCVRLLPRAQSSCVLSTSLASLASLLADLGTFSANGKSVVVRLVDMCGGCKPSVPHVRSLREVRRSQSP